MQNEVARLACINLQLAPRVAGMANSPLYELLATRLDKDPVVDIKARREAGESWRKITHAYLLEHGIEVTDVTLRSWVQAAAAETPA